MFGELLGPMIALAQGIRAGKAIKSWNKAFNKMGKKGEKTTTITKPKAMTPQEKKVANFVQKKNAQLNSPDSKNNPLANVPVAKLGGSPKLDVGKKLQPYVNAQKIAPKTFDAPKKTISQVKLPSQNKNPLNVGQKLQNFKSTQQKVQNKNIGKQLSNPVSMESKIKKVMGVSD